MNDTPDEKATTTTDRTYRDSRDIGFKDAVMGGRFNNAAVEPGASVPFTNLLNEWANS